MSLDLDAIGGLADAMETMQRRIREQDAVIERLREALEGMTELWLNVGGTELNPAYENAIAALDSKGGER